ncbi:class I SAM-dependent methyltransferase [Persicimonas caeni]|uniref:Class I SAM-dependent methyltransferase n=1 Tax=Persicimonas caeni TaxID=2292766 RepID=A0A4Y6Q040_PERCE|nr:class I SAM-dependent methyltransferase [Persicimonas caeni]QDG53958.1 class I SAM-dependent methyltransferase [Persicimonas caeni]QED35179.1 class I SAM-dependent methyltransferase [Persicimonas caeni]
MADDMYGRRAWLYDLIYDGKDYASEVERLRQILSDHGVESGASVLEAACGTGNYLEHLVNFYDSSGFDISADMLALARHKVAEVELFEADMFAFTPKKTYDAVLCLFSSLSYADSLAQLERAARNFYEALRPGGVLVVEPWIGPGDAEPGRPFMKTYQDDDIKVCRQFVSKEEGRRATLDFHWLVAERGEDVEYFTTQLVAYLYSATEYRQALEDAGFEVVYDSNGVSGRGLFVARR